jgi:hypothetical protein
VGDAPILRDEFLRAVAAAVEDRADHRDDANVRQAVLDRLVEERILVRAALELGLPMRDPRLREDLASAMSDLVAGGPLEPPSDDSLRSYEISHAASFTRGGRLRIEALSFRGKDAGDRADGARARLLLGQPAADIARTADVPALTVPPEAASVPRLAEVFGMPFATAIDALAPGEVTDVVAVQQDLWVARLVTREGGDLAPLSEVRSDLTAGWSGQERAHRLQRWIDERRKGTRVVVREVLF